MIPNLKAECSETQCDWSRTVRYPKTDVEVVHAALSHIVREPTHLVQIYVLELPEDLATVTRLEDEIVQLPEDEIAS